jgi:hypothetical protein
MGFGVANPTKGAAFVAETKLFTKVVAIPCRRYRGSTAIDSIHATLPADEEISFPNKYPTPERVPPAMKR